MNNAIIGEIFNELNKSMNAILNSDSYIAKRDYKELLEKYSSSIEEIKILIENNVFQAFCQNNHLEKSFILDILNKYRNFPFLVDNKNELWVKKELETQKEYLDTILFDIDKEIHLDEDQRKVVLEDEDYTLVIAGAGAGKTTTIAAKVKYLVEKKKINPEQILVISFTNKAVQELQERINKGLGIDAIIATFHKTGNAIIHKQSTNNANIIEPSSLYFIIEKYFRTSILTKEELVKKLILFFSTYFDVPEEEKNLDEFLKRINKTQFFTMRSELDDFKEEIIDKRTKKRITIQNENLRSQEEVQIANFLYLNNIDYTYEPLYPYNILLAKKPYTPDFCIKQGNKIAYIEHFGITEDGKNNHYDEKTLDKYKNAIKEKIELHKQHHTNLIYTYSKYKDNRFLLEHLKEQLIENGFILKERSSKEIMEKLISTEENRYIKRLISLISRFITNFKTNGYTIEDFKRMYNQTNNERTKLFLSICEDCYLEYNKYLHENNYVDFQDLINESARILKEVKEMKQILDFKYIIVDEYQDISRQRFNLIKELKDVTNAKIIAVGDDWQSIYAFSGSDITLFTKFQDLVGYANLLKIENTYRNSQEIIDIAGNFIRKNTYQIQKSLKSPKTIKDPIIIFTYDASPKKKDASNKTGMNYERAKALEKALEHIKQNNPKKDLSILLLGRFGFDIDFLERSGLFERVSKHQVKSIHYPKLNLTFMTVHASKGLGYDEVIVINGKNDTYGFPSKIEDDPVLSLVLKEDKTFDYAEERRLFYVALTRTKNRVYFIAPEQSPSLFLKEIKNDYKNVLVKGNWDIGAINNDYMKKKCPICGFPLQYRYKKSYGLPLFICTNEPEICSFMTNVYDAGKLSIIKCDSCKDGYLIVKTNNEKYFLGCTNYKKDGSGCNRTMSKQQFYELFHLKNDPVSIDTILEEIKQEKETEILEIKKPNLENVFYKDIDLNETVYTILKGLLHISSKKFYSMDILVQVLLGTTSELIEKDKLNQIAEYGKLKDIPKEILYKFIHWLIKNHFIIETKERISKLHLASFGQYYDENINNKLLKDLKHSLEIE